jgi:hypothetical protein
MHSVIAALVSQLDGKYQPGKESHDVVAARQVCVYVCVSLSE